MSKYLVTGGCGFIGAHLCSALLNANHEVFVLDNLSNSNRENLPSGAHFLKADAREDMIVRELLNKVDGCFHLAAIPSVVMKPEEWRESHSNNLDASINVFQQAILAGKIPVVYASSCAVYGNTDTLPLHENLLLKPISAYGVDKLSSEMNARVATLNYGLPTFGLRFFNVYGKGQNPNSPYSGVITHFINGMQSDKAITIYGDGTQTRDFVYVEDIVSALIKAMSLVGLETAQVVNVCRGESVSINELAAVIARVLKRTPKIHYDSPRSFDVQHSCGATENARKFGIHCEYNLHEGLQKMFL
jgi:UDP-glucose 4-epimerase